MCAFGCWAGLKMFLHEKGACQNDMKTVFFTIFWFLLNGPVKNALFCLMDRYWNVCVWFMARNCRFPKVGTHCCQRGNHRLPLQGTAGSQKLELLVSPTWEPWDTIARKLPVPPGNQRLPLQATDGSQRLELMLPNLGTIGYHCKELPIPQGWN